jgi:hypothetical protein
MRSKVQRPHVNDSRAALLAEAGTALNAGAAGQARERLKEALRRSERRRPDELTFTVLRRLGQANRAMGDLAGARRSYERAAQIASDLRSDDLRSGALEDLAFVSRAENNLEDALELLRETARLALPAGNRIRYANALANLASVLDELGRPSEDAYRAALKCGDLLPPEQRAMLEDKLARLLEREVERGQPEMDPSSSHRDPEPHPYPPNGDSEPPPDGPRSKTAYALIEAPDEVAVGLEFEAVVGLADALDAAVATTHMKLPERDMSLTIHVTADGFRLRPGQSWRHEVSLAAGGELPRIRLDMTAEPQEPDVREARLQALYMVDGETVGFGSRSLVVAREPMLMANRRPSDRDIGGEFRLPERTIPPDLTVSIRKGRLPGELMWVFDTSHDLQVSDEQAITSIGDDPQSFARQLIRSANQREGRSDLFAFLRGIGKQVADQLPGEFHDLYRKICEIVGRPPLILLLSEEPYVPWELAWMEPPVDASAPNFLSAQAVVGRWVLATRRPALPPPVAGSGTSMAVITGVYDRASGRTRLDAAEAEARELASLYGAEEVDAKLDPVMRCLEGAPCADVLHFAVHGIYDPEGKEDGLILTDQCLDPTVVSGMSMPGNPFVFLNACQVGTSGEVLGDYAGLTQAFLQAGACAAVAPLWSVKDTVAMTLALRFYDQALAGAPPAEVLRCERAGLGPSPQLTSGTHLAYQFFGHPAMALKSASAGVA